MYNHLFTTKASPYPCCFPDLSDGQHVLPMCESLSDGGITSLELPCCWTKRHNVVDAVRSENVCRDGDHR